MSSVVQGGSRVTGTGLGLRRVIRVTVRASDMRDSDLRCSIGEGGE